MLKYVSPKGLTLWLKRRSPLKISVFYLLLTLLGIQVVFSKPVRPPEPLPKQGIIDMHVHIACLNEKIGCFVAKELRDNFRFPIYLKAMGTSIEVLESQGDGVVARHISQNIAASKYVSKGVILAMDGVIDRRTGALDLTRTMVMVPNAFVAKASAQYNNLLFGASINPYRHDALQRLEAVKKQGAVLIKWIPSIMDIDPADPALTAFYEKMKALKLPLLTHTGQEKSFTTANDALADPRRLILPLKLGVTVIAAHIASTGENDGIADFERILPMFEKYPNLYADISSLTQINKRGYLNQALKHSGLDKHLIYGTDWPLQFFPIVSPWYFPFNLSIKQMWKLSRIANQWDADVQLKQALGVPAAVFKRSETLLLPP